MRSFFTPPTVFLFALIFTFSLFVSPARAQTAYKCDTPEEKAICTALLDQTEKEIASLGTQLSSKAQEGSSLQRDKAVLDLQIKQAQLKIKARELSIAKLGKDITAKTNAITTLSGKIDNGKDAMSQIIRRTHEVDNLSIAEAFLSNRSLADFFIDLDTFSSIRIDLEAKLNNVKEDKQQNEEEKDQLNTQRNKELDLKKEIESEKAKVQAAEAEKRRLLALNKNEQQNYQTQIANKKVEATKIRNALFALRDAAAIKFGDAVMYAKAASAKTGVRAAFILGIIQQESNLGANVGQCYLTGENGAGIRKSSGAVVTNLMKASRDVQPFLQITRELGRDPYKTVVSCPLSVGYGGAMGPAQFIPSTWVLISGKIEAATGKSIADPWDPQDAFMASAFYLSDLGAAGGSYTAERNAACRYYSGKNCTGSTQFYGNQVMSRVDGIQANIDILQGL
ncbi:MAG: lytic murein transglycosylase [Patescibacteria group bacterium]